MIGLLLAGGRATRMGGGDKCLRLLAGRPILDHVIERLRPQLSRLLLNANGDPARFAAYGLPVVGDSPPDFAGPLAGVLAGLEWAARGPPDHPLLLSAPTDAPFLPRDLVRRLWAGRAAEGADIAMAASGGRTHPVVGLWPVALAPALRHALVVGGVAQGRYLDRALSRGGGGFSHRGGRSLLQRQPAGGSGRGGTACRARSLEPDLRVSLMQADPILL